MLPGPFAIATAANHVIGQSRAVTAVVIDSVNIHFSKLANSRTKIVSFSYKNTTGYQNVLS